MPRWILQLVLRAWPARARTRHGRGLGQTLDAAWRDAARERAIRCAFQRAALLIDALAAGLAERRTAGRARRHPATARSGATGAAAAAIASDGRHAWRRLRARPGSAAVAIGMLTIAIGITAAMFTVLDALVLRPVPFRDPQRLVNPRIARAQRFLPRAPRELLQAWRSMPAFEAVHGVLPLATVIEGGAEPIMEGGALVTPGTFGMLGVSPVLGRAFAPGDGRAGTSDVAIVSEEIWRTHFAADPSLIGRRIRLSGESVDVVGVMPAGFRFPLWTTQVWRPIDIDAPPPAQRGIQLMATARLGAGMPREDAARLATVALHDAKLADVDTRVIFRPLTAGFVDRYSTRAIMALTGGAALVFLALCANVASLLLARLSARSREVGVCSALGASRARLLREALFEHALLGAAGSGAGLAVGAFLVALARHYLPDAFLLRTLNPLDLDVRTLAAACALGSAATILSGLAPAWIGTRPAAGISLRSIERGATASRAHIRGSRAILAAEIVLATMLLMGTGTLVRSFVNLVRADRGVETAGVIGGTVTLPRHAFDDSPSRFVFVDGLNDGLRRVPGITEATISYGMPPGAGETYFGDWQSDMPGAQPQNFDVNVYAVEPGFFNFFRVRLRQGRLISAVDVPEAVVIGEALARRLWPGIPPIGRWFGQDGRKEFQVVGVVNEIRTLLVDPRRDTYEMYRSARVIVDGGVRGRAFGSGAVSIAVRCAPCPELDAIRRSVHAVSAHAVVQQLRPLDQDYLEALARPRAAAALAFAFALTSTLAAAGGLFSVLGYAVTRRRREFGIRAAMGAAPAQLQRLILRDGLQITAIGLVLGIVPAWIVARFLSSLAYEVSATDPVIWCAVTAVIALTAIAATWHPARRAMRISPVRLLVEE